MSTKKIEKKVTMVAEKPVVDEVVAEAEQPPAVAEVQPAVVEVVTVPLRNLPVGAIFTFGGVKYQVASRTISVVNVDTGQSVGIDESVEVT